MTKPKPPEEHGKPGAPTAYKPEYDDLARKFCLLTNATDKKLAAFFEVSEQTINAWKIASPTFLESIKAGKLGADLAVVDSAHRQTLGQMVEVREMEMTPPDAEGKSTVLSIKVKQQYYPPSATATKFWLMNRHGADWREKLNVAHAGPNGTGPVLTGKISDEEAEKAYLDMLNGAAASVRADGEDAE